MDELEISRKAIAGDEASFLAMMRQYKEDLLRTALAFLKNEHDALEALQEVTVRAYHKIQTVKEPAYAKTWLIRIMINYCQDQLKRQKRFHHDPAIDSQSTVDDSLLELKEALATLPKKEQQLIYLKYFQDVKIKDIAKIENIPEGTVKSRLHKTLRSLRAYFEDEGGREHV
ncbi:RNA polymerase subunit sigma-24 [Sporosarcina sp. BI001-red]|uniref:sigma-70 family RNA polymerase sigma factor n=1 Tax=Sporosarcina sp. BI001-red TaxID=2282866 RepID=UPI000E21FBCF|nr:sigma-70 family RNA polymerase sigma factor [Sporosarcina sp. BI001-red]REB05249.1 RNA polymerase subunit sigma-24 [Sporosarcina sp. BI001-red]